MGKSALVLAGLLPRLHTPMTPSHGANRLLQFSSMLPFLGWQHGLRNAVTRPCTPSQQTSLVSSGASHLAMRPTRFGWLARSLHPGARQRLFILDQMGDYPVAHQPQIVSRRKVMSPSGLVAANADLAALARQRCLSLVSEVMQGESQQGRFWRSW